MSRALGLVERPDERVWVYERRLIDLHLGAEAALAD